MSFGHHADDREHDGREIEDYELEARRIFARFDGFARYLPGELEPFDLEIRGAAGEDLGPCDPIDDDDQAEAEDAALAEWINDWDGDPWAEEWDEWSDAGPFRAPAPEALAEWAALSNVDAA